MNDNVLLHLEDAVNQVRALFLKAATRIEELKPGEKVPATQLAADLAAERGMTGPQLYPTLLFLIKNYPGVEVKRGAHGGICRPLPKPVEELKVVDALAQLPATDAETGAVELTLVP